MKSELQKMFEKYSEGKTPEEYTKKLSDVFIKYLIDMEYEDMKGWYKYFGGYWELVYPIFKKYNPEELKEYEDLLNEEFTYFNPRVREILDTGEEHYNIMLAVKYFNNRLDNYAGVNDIHYIEADDSDDEIIPYIPNQALDY